MPRFLHDKMKPAVLDVYYIAQIQAIPNADKVKTNRRISFPHILTAEWIYGMTGIRVPSIAKVPGIPLTYDTVLLYIFSEPGS